MTDHTSTQNQQKREMSLREWVATLPAPVGETRTHRATKEYDALVGALKAVLAEPMLLSVGIGMPSLEQARAALKQAGEDG